MAEHTTEDFDAFWAARERKGKTTTIMGVAVTLPPALPLQFEMEARRLERSKREADIHKLVAILFGDDAYETWAEGGMDLEQFMVLLAWAPRVIQGQSVTLAEVADEVAARMAADEDGDGPDPT
jgi:hypothetical protein